MRRLLEDRISEEEMEDYIEQAIQKSLEKGIKLDGSDQCIRERIKQGILEGMQTGKINMLVSLVKDGLIKLEDAVQRVDITEEEFLKLMNCGEQNTMENRELDIVNLVKKMVNISDEYDDFVIGLINYTKKLLKNKDMVNLLKKIVEIPDVYDDFLLGVINFARKDPKNLEELEIYLEKNSQVTTSNVVEFIYQKSR